MNISGLIALVGVIFLVLGFLALASVVSLPAVPFLVFGVICLVIAAFLGGGFSRLR